MQEEEVPLHPGGVKVKKIRAVLVGFGNIGRGLARAIRDNENTLRQNGIRIDLVAVCEVKGCITEPDGIDVDKLLTGKLKWGRRKTLDVIREVEAEVVVEVTPGNIKDGKPGITHIREALKSGKHVVTSNKSPIVVDYKGLKKLSRKNNVEFRFEATVGGAIPVISTIKRELHANNPKRIYGILNGTTNFILTKMLEEEVDFKSALKEAQDLGYAETDPTYDISGIDTASKVVILANELLDMDVKLKDVDVEGIQSISLESIQMAKENGYCIKLIGDVTTMKVRPMLVPIDHPINVGGSLNAVFCELDLADDLCLIGHGAGPKQTASALLSDIIHINCE